jgi:hypothetical protein
MAASAFTGFREVGIPTPGGPVLARIGGAGRPLLQGCPESQIMWGPAADPRLETELP